MRQLELRIPRTATMATTPDSEEKLPNPSLGNSPVKEPEGLEVLIVASETDRHCESVQRYLLEQGRRVGRLDVHDLFAEDVFWTSDDAFHIRTADQNLEISSRTTIWWHRPGTLAPKDSPPSEEHFWRAELPVFLEGLLLSSFPRWVDPPDVIDRAEKKLYQLAIAKRLRIPIPTSAITTDELEAKRLARKTPLLTKPLSSGPGFAPHARIIPHELLHLVREAPTFLQEVVRGDADLRIVTIADRAFVWRRPRKPGEPVDWREPDLSGEGFVRCHTAHEAESLALRIADALELTMSSQDWVEANNKLFFLEANPQGNWLFLDGASEEIVPALAEHLLDSPPHNGYWPPAWRQFYWDLLLSKRAPPNSGLKPPHFERPTWLAEDQSALPEVADLARRAREDALQRAGAAEIKGNRLVTMSLTLLGLSISFTGYIATNHTTSPIARWVLAGAALLAAFLLALATINALEIDRVGLYARRRTERLAKTRDLPREMVWLEEQGRLFADWNACHKLTMLLHARAWFSRGIVVLLADAAFWLAFRLFHSLSG